MKKLFFEKRKQSENTGSGYRSSDTHKIKFIASWITFFFRTIYRYPNDINDQLKWLLNNYNLIVTILSDLKECIFSGSRNDVNSRAFQTNFHTFIFFILSISNL